MKKLLFLIIVFLFLTSPAFACPKEVQKYCAREWPGNYEKQAHCYKRQVKAIMEMKTLMTKYNFVRKDGKYTCDDENIELIFGKCLMEGKILDFDFRMYNSPMVVNCIKKQIATYEGLKSE